MITTRTQQMAQRAFDAVGSRKPNQQYASFAKSFPALIQTAGLCQAVAFAQAKGREVLEDVIATIGRQSPDGGHVAVSAFADQCRRAALQQYVRLTRHTLLAAMWVKRFVEALAEQTNTGPDAGEPVRDEARS
jgi:CRISPR-associated protein Cmr5